MRRRLRKDDENEMPRHLRYFNATDWPSTECHPECAYWKAVEEWRLEHPINLDDARALIILDGPDVPFHPREIRGAWLDAAHDNQVM